MRRCWQSTALRQPTAQMFRLLAWATWKIVMQQIHLSREEELMLEPVLSSLSRKAGYTLTLPLLLERWENFVSEVEVGYGDSIYEYMNDLTTRDLLQKIVDNCPIALHSRLVEAIQIWVDRFRKVTKESKQSKLTNKGKTQSWWWFRIPAKLGEELRSDLELDGLS
jgi:hypothetical protein